MSSYLLRKVIGGTICGLVAGSILSAFILVGAVAPGVVSSPTFGPTDDDVILNYDISCDWNGWMGYNSYPNGSPGYISIDIGQYAHHTAYGLAARCDAGVLKELKWLQEYYHG